MVSLAGPLMDLGYWLYWDRFLAPSRSLRPAGFPSRAETIATWEARTGIPADGVEWYEVLAALEVALVVARVMKLASAFNDNKPHGIVSRAVGAVAELLT
jgi:aminoglycoside phosphotransferase (APT) family kinase protein